MTKTCSKCGERKSLDRFSTDGRAIRADCRDCQNAYAREYHVRTNRAIVRHHISFEEYERLVGLGCAICHKVATFMTIDHDKKCCPDKWSCGQCIRGVLCKKHNTALGGFDDDPEMLRAALEYLETSSRGKLSPNETL